MMTTIRPGIGLAMALAFVSLALSAGLKAQTLNVPLHFSAVAQDLDRGLSTALRITIDRWSSDTVRDTLVKTLMTQGEDKLLGALQGAPTVGSIRTVTSLAWDLHFARQTPGED